jgi:hypothetical protein
MRRSGRSQPGCSGAETGTVIFERALTQELSKGGFPGVLSRF